MNHSAQPPTPEHPTAYAAAPARARQRRRRHAVLAVCTAICAALMPPASAQEWPTKPIRTIVPFAAGEPSDRLARDVATWDPILRTLGTRIQ